MLFQISYLLYWHFELLFFFLFHKNVLLKFFCFFWLVFSLSVVVKLILGFQSSVFPLNFPITYFKLLCSFILCNTEYFSILCVLFFSLDWLLFQHCIFHLFFVVLSRLISKSIFLFFHFIVIFLLVFTTKYLLVTYPTLLTPLLYIC